MIWLAILPATFILYFAISYYLLTRPTKNFAFDYTDRSFLNDKKFSTAEELISAEEQLLKTPSDIALRLKCICARSTNLKIDPISKGLEHAYWFAENAPLHPINKIFGSAQIYYCFTNNEDKELNEKKYSDVWKNNLTKHPDDLEFLYAAAENLFSIDGKFSRECWKKILLISPFFAASLEALGRMAEFDLPRDYRTAHPQPALNETLRLRKKRLRWPWSDRASSRLEQWRIKYGRAYFPNWLCLSILYLNGILNPKSNIWQDYYFVSHLGMIAYQSGEYDLAKRCCAQFLKLQPAAQKVHPHLPLYATGFSLAAILALKENDMEKVNYYLDKKSENLIDSVYDFMFNDKEILIELVRHGKIETAVKFMEKRAGEERFKNKEIQFEIDLVKTGVIPMSEVYYEKFEKSHKSKSE